jgi:hypothetical protein
VVLARRQEVDRHIDLARVDRHVGERDAAGILQHVPLVHAVQVEALHRRRHAGRIGIPVQQVESARIAAHQVVVDHEEPDQVVLAQQVERLRHVMALEVAALVHVLVGERELVGVDEHRNVADVGEVEQRGEQRRGRDALLAARRQVGERARDERAADAVAEDVEVGLRGRPLDRLDGGDRPLQQVVGKILVAELGAGVDPGDHEHRLSLVNAPLDERVLRLEVEDVELVDPGRHDQQRTALHRRGRRRVLDQLHELVLKDDLAGRVGDVLAELEGGEIAHFQAQPAAAALEVLDQVAQALDQVLAPALERGLEHRRIGRGKIGGRQGVDELARVELCLMLDVRIDARHAAHRRFHAARRQQVGLLDEVEQRIVAPDLVLEALVLRTGRDHGLRLDLEQRPGGRALPQQAEVLPQRHLLAKQSGWIHGGLLGERLKRCHDRARIHHLIAVVGFQSLDVASHERVAAPGDISQGIDRLGAQQAGGRGGGHPRAPVDVRICGLVHGRSSLPHLVRIPAIRRHALGAARDGADSPSFADLCAAICRCLDLDQRMQPAGSAACRPSGARYHRAAVHDGTAAPSRLEKIDPDQFVAGRGN